MTKYAGNKWVTLVLVCLAQFMVILDATIVNIALPAIQTDLGFSDANLQWVVNSYTLLFGGFLLLGGRAADLLGRKRVFIAGVILFSVASLLNGLATNARCRSSPSAPSRGSVARSSPRPRCRSSRPRSPRARSARRRSASGARSRPAAAPFGLLLGGVLVEALSWEWVFFVNVPVGIAAAFLSSRLIVESKAERAGSFDIAGAVLVTSGLMVLVYAIVRAEQNGWASATTLGLGAIALAPADRVRRGRVAHPRPAGPAGHLQDPLARGQQRRVAADRRRPVRPVLLRVAVRAADPRLLADRGRAWRSCP